MMAAALGTTREQVLQALEARLRLALETGFLTEPLPEVWREQDGPELLPPGGLVVLRDGDPGEPEVTLSPLRYHWEHQAEIDILVTGPAAARIARFDAICAVIGLAVPPQDTLGGLCDWVEPGAPVPQAVGAEDGETVKAATIPVILAFSTASALI